MYKRKSLTDQAAREDAKLIYDKALSFLCEYMTIFFNGNKEKIREKAETCFDGHYLSAIEAELLPLYAYCRADKKVSDALYTFDALINISLNKISSVLFMSAFSVDLRRTSLEEGTIEKFEKICPRTCYAFKVALARQELHTANNVQNGTVSTAAVSLLADVSYTYIIKLIKQGNLPAIKKARQWHIPADDALNFVAKYYPEELETALFLKDLDVKSVDNLFYNN